MSVRDLLARGTSGRTYPEHATGAARASASPAPKRFALEECVHLGARTGTGCGSLVRACNLHNTTTTAFTRCPDAERHCPACPDFTRPAEQRPAPRAVAAPLPRFSWVSTSQLVADAVLLAGELPADCAGIVGVPRSGMIPASAIATHLHLPLYTLGESGPVSVGAGSRGGTLYRAAGPLAVVDDTVYGGGAMNRARQVMGGRPAIYSAVYARPEAADAVSVFARELPCPHLLEWNLLNNGPAFGRAAGSTGGFFGAGIAVDLDGILVHDEQSGGRPGAPYLTCRMHPLRLIVTGRSEASRSFTESQLRSLGIQWERLEMLPANVPLSTESAARFKADHYGASACGLYVESCPTQAERIHRLTGKPVACPIASRVWLSAGASGELARRCNLHNCTTSAHTKCPRAERHCPTCPDFAPPPEVPT